MMVIIEAQLPPLKGFVETEVDGVRVYQEIESKRIYTPESAQKVLETVGQYTALELTQQTITDLDLELIQMGQEMTDMELTMYEMVKISGGGGHSKPCIISFPLEVMAA